MVTTLGSIFMANGIPVTTTARPARSAKSRPSLTYPFTPTTQRGHKAPTFHVTVEPEQMAKKEDSENFNNTTLKSTSKEQNDLTLLVAKHKLG